MADFDAASVIEQMAKELFTWNTPSHPFFVTHGRAGEPDQDPYLTIVGVTLPTAVKAVTDAVRALHYHDVFRGHLDNGCKVCGWGPDGEYPCPTVKLCDEIDQAAGVQP